MFGLGAKAAPAPPAAPAAPGSAKEITSANLRTEVLQESMRQPVLVLFYVPASAPCQALGAALEKAVKASGKVKLVRMNADAEPAIAAQLGIQAIPAVIAFDRGQPLDGFVGPLPEAGVKAFIERLVGPAGPGAIDEVIAEGEAALAEGDAAGAAEVFAAALEQEPDNAQALGGFARAQVAVGALDQARAVLDAAPAALAKAPAIAGARAALLAAEQAAALGDLAELQARVDADPSDHQARFDLALGLNGKGRRDLAGDHLLAIIKADRAWNEDGARKQLLQFFEAWGLTDPASISARRRLSSLLF